MKKSLSEALRDVIKQYQPNADQADGGKCSNCFWRGPLKGLQSYEDYESCEHPQTYTVHLCPECEYDIEEYYYLKGDDEAN